MSFESFSFFFSSSRGREKMKNEKTRDMSKSNACGTQRLIRTRDRRSYMYRTTRRKYGNQFSSQRPRKNIGWTDCPKMTHRWAYIPSFVYTYLFRLDDTPYWNWPIKLGHLRQHWNATPRFVEHAPRIKKIRLMLLSRRASLAIMTSVRTPYWRHWTEGQQSED